MKKGKWSIIVVDKIIVKQYDEGLSAGIGYIIESENFWSSNLNSNVKAIQYTGIPDDIDQVEYRDGTHNSVFTGNIKIFSDEWDKKHLEHLQSIWDNNNILKNPTNPKDSQQVQLQKILLGECNIPETQEEKLNRLGPRPQTYNSSDIY
jgi:hypothetical protein